MIRKILSYTLVAVVISAISWYAYIQFSAADAGDLAPEIKTNLSDGTPFKLSNLKGEYVVLEFWGSWCGPCRKHNRDLVAFHESYADKAEIVTVALEKDATKGKRVAEIDGFTWTYQIVEETQFVMMSDIAQKYGVSSIPATFLISPDGILIGEKSLEEIKTILDKD
jgi:thiol-disulfide isomerase/thioredoxin